MSRRTLAPRSIITAVVFVILASAAIASAQDSSSNEPATSVTQHGEKPPHWLDVRLGGEVGGGRVTLLGTRHAAIEVGVAVIGNLWLSKHLGVGVRVQTTYAIPYTDEMNPVRRTTREIPWLLEPQLLVRSTPSRWLRFVESAWIGSIGAGPAWLLTTDSCRDPITCYEVRERSTVIGGAITGGWMIAVSRVAVTTSGRASANAGGDLSLGLDVSAGITF